MPPRTIPGPRGLKLWTSVDANHSTFTEYLPPNTTTYKDGTNDACVICAASVRVGPSNPPAWTQASDIGDSYVWSEPHWHLPAINRTYYVISGGGRCPQNTTTGPNMWCGWQRGRSPQILLFSSKNLVDWRFCGEYWNGTGVEHKGIRVDTPDTFTFPSGEQVLIWLGQTSNTQWVTGRADWSADSPVFVPQSLNGNPSTGFEDLGGGTHCGQSEWDAYGRRVQFMWVRLSEQSFPYKGAQSLPREIVVAPAGSVTGLLFRPLPEIGSLHTTQAPDINVTLGAHQMSETSVLKPSDGLHCHIQATVSFSPNTASVVSIKTLAGTNVSVDLLMARDYIVLNGKNATISETASGSGDGESTTFVELFVDGPIIEVFANHGERSMTYAINSPFEPTMGTDITVSLFNTDHVDWASHSRVGQGPVSAEMVVWAMRKSINVVQEE